MKISTRLIVLFVGITFISTVFVALLTTQGARTALRDEIGTNYQDHASEGASSIEILLRDRIREAQQLAGRQQVLDAVREANRRYDGRSEEEIAIQIHSIDEAWIAAKGKNAAAAQVRDSEVADFLRAWSKTEPKRYGEIFVTDRRGAAVGMTGKLSDYDQADEQWWLEGFADGRGVVFLDDRGLDETTNSLVIGTVVPVRDGDRVIGLLKINYNIDALFTLPLASGGRTFLARGNGQVITASGEGAAPVLQAPDIAAMYAGRTGWAESQGSAGPRLRAYAPASIAIHSRVHVAGERPGISGEYWESTGWYVFLDVPSDTVFASLENLQQMAVIVTLVALLMAGLVAVATARSLSRPLQALREGAGRIADGDLGQRLPVDTGDEIGELAAAFNKMAESLESQMGALRSSEERLRLMTNNVKDYAIIMLDPDGQVYSWNEGAQRLKGYDYKDIIGQPIARFYTPEDIAAGRPTQLLEVATREGRVEDEGWRVRKDGSRFYADVVLSAIHDAGGMLIGFAKITRDITESKAAEDLIRQLNAGLENQVAERTTELQAANRELESFAYAISHDLRAPLRAMIGFSQALVEDYGESLDTEAKIYLDQIVIGSTRMGELVDGLLTLSRSTRGELQRDEVDLSALAERLLAELAQTESERQVSWEVATGLVACGDGRLLEAVMRNLLDNAWKYTAGTPEATIRVYADKNNQQPVFCVADNGAGFDMAHAGKLFQPFQRLHRQEEFVGIGIGLATVQRIVHRHGGEIQAEAAPGQGARFCFSLGHSQANDFEQQ